MLAAQQAANAMIKSGATIARSTMDRAAAEAKYGAGVVVSGIPCHDGPVTVVELDGTQ